MLGKSTSTRRGLREAYNMFLIRLKLNPVMFGSDLSPLIRSSVAHQGWGLPMSVLTCTIVYIRFVSQVLPHSYIFLGFSLETCLCQFLP